MNVSRLSKYAGALVVTGLLLAAPVHAQDQNANGGTQSAQSTQADDGSNWGWIGLLGLAGLLGLRRRSDVPRDDTRGRGYAS